MGEEGGFLQLGESWGNELGGIWFLIEVKPFEEGENFKPGGWGQQGDNSNGEDENP